MRRCFLNEISCSSSVGLMLWGSRTGAAHRGPRICSAYSLLLDVNRPLNADCVVLDHVSARVPTLSVRELNDERVRDVPANGELKTTTGTRGPLFQYCSVILLWRLARTTGKDDPRHAGVRASLRGNKYAPPKLFQEDLTYSIERAGRDGLVVARSGGMKT